MTIRFKRRLGAAADVAELEYCIALHQTCPETRKNATVSSRDVQRLLTSRYGLSLSHRQAIELVRSLSGGGTTVDSPAQSGSHKKRARRARNSASLLRRSQQLGSPSDVEQLLHEETTASRKVDDHVEHTNRDLEEGIESTMPARPSNGLPDPGTDPKGEDSPEEYMDLVQILSILLIPTLARIADEFRFGPHPEPYVDETVIRHRLLRCFQPLVRLYDRFRAWWADRRYAQYNQLRPKPHDVLPDAVPRFWSSALGLPSDPLPPVVDEDLVRALLIKHGELERATNASLVREMVKVARSSSGRLDAEAFVNAVSLDLTDWVVGSEDMLSTHFEDVFGTSHPTSVKQLKLQDPPGLSAQDRETCRESEERPQPTKSGRRILSKTVSWLWFVLSLGNVFGYCSPKESHVFAVESSNIDYVLDAHSSLVAAVLIWVFSVLTITVYDETTWCLIVDKIFLWAALAAVYCILGVIIIVPLSIGNNPFTATRLSSVVSASFAVIYAIFPFVIYEITQQLNAMDAAGSDSTSTTPYDSVQGKAFTLGRYIAILSGLLLPVLFVFHAVSLSFQSTKYYSYEAMGLVRWILSPSNMRAEMRLKWAATSKVNSMLTNACRLHFLRRSATDIVPSERLGELATARLTDRATENFLLCGEHFQVVGGFIWTWRRILNGSLFDEEGIWLNSRLIVLQASQIIFGMAASILLYQLVEVTADRSQASRDALEPGLPEWYYDLFPTKGMVEWALYPAWVVAVVVIVLLICVYIPSAVSTVLKYRCQLNPSLGSPYFQRFRVAVDLTYMNAANAVWAMLGSAVLFYAVFGLLLFLFIWPWSASFMKNLLAWGVGLEATILMKMVLTMYCRRHSYRNFYRIDPSVAQVSSLALECWYIALGGAIILGRVMQFLLAAAFWVGRIDVPFLHPDVSLFGYSFDYVPTHFTKDLLVHEAHRHPYMERLAQMYLMKLRQDSFVSEAGAAWRQLTILSVFPWLSKCRVFDADKVEQAKKALVHDQLSRAQKTQRPILIRMASAIAAEGKDMAEKAMVPVTKLDVRELVGMGHSKSVDSNDEENSGGASSQSATDMKGASN